MDTIRISHGQPGQMWGRAVANHSFVLGLIEAAGGHRITLIVKSRSDVQLLQETLLAEHGDAVSVVPLLELVNFLQMYPVDVMHNLDPNIWTPTHIRNWLSETHFIVTGVTHSLANEHFLSWALLANANGVIAADHLICTTPTAKTVLDTALGRLADTQPEFRSPSTSVIPLGVATQTYVDGPAPDRERFGFHPDEFVILSLARFNPLFKMDYLPLLNLMQLILADASHPVRLVLAGASDDGSYCELVSEWAERLGLTQHVSFVLDPDDDAKAVLYRTADVFLSLSDNVQETFGLTIIESMAAGLPAVVSDWDGYKSLIEDGVNGFLVPTMTMAPATQWEALMALLPDSDMHLFNAQTTAVDLNAAARQLLQLSNDPDLTSAMSHAASERADRYDWSVVCRDYLELWQRLVSEHARDDSQDPAVTRRSSHLRLLEDFASYPTSQLSTEDRFRISPLGEDILARKRQLYLYGQLAEIMDLRTLNGLLGLCAETGADGLSLAEASAGLDTPDADVARNLMWLYKYGYVRKNG